MRCVGLKVREGEMWRGEGGQRRQGEGCCISEIAQTGAAGADGRMRTSYEDREHDRTHIQVKNSINLSKKTKNI